MIERFLLALILICSIATPQYCQDDDLTADKAFFEAESKVYQKWLEYAGMGNVLKVHSVEVTPDELSLYLGFHTTDISEIISSWNRLQKDFEDQEKALLASLAKEEAEVRSWLWKRGTS